MSFAIVCVMFIVHTMPRHWVYLKMGLPDAYAQPAVWQGHGAFRCHGRHQQGQGLGDEAGEAYAAVHDAVGGCAGSEGLRVGELPRSRSTLQRLQPVAAMSRTLVDCHQAVTGHDDYRQREGQLCKVQPPFSKFAAL